MEKLTSFISRILFILAFTLAASAVSEKMANMFGFDFFRNYSPSRLLELSAIALFFVVALQLREIKLHIKTTADSI